MLALALAFTNVIALASSVSYYNGKPYGGGGGSYVPWAAVNIAPFQILYNCNLCFYFNQSTACPPNYLNQTGRINVQPSRYSQFCSPQCLRQQFNETLNCINKVTRNNRLLTFKFTNGATVSQLKTTVDKACARINKGKKGNFTVPKTK